MSFVKLQPVELFLNRGNLLSNCLQGSLSHSGGLICLTMEHYNSRLLEGRYILYFYHHALFGKCIRIVGLKLYSECYILAAKSLTDFNSGIGVCNLFNGVTPFFVDDAAHSLFEVLKPYNKYYLNVMPSPFN